MSFSKFPGNVIFQQNLIKSFTTNSLEKKENAIHISNKYLLRASCIGTALYVVRQRGGSKDKPDKGPCPQGIHVILSDKTQTCK